MAGPGLRRHGMRQMGTLVPTIHDQFASALKSRLNGGFKPSLSEPGVRCCPSLARQVEVAEDIITAATAEALGVPFQENLGERQVSHEFIVTVPIAFARRHTVIGLASEGDAMTVALADLAQWPHVHTLGKVLGKRILPVFAPRREILRVINVAYQQQSGQAERLIGELDSGQVMDELNQASQSEDLLDLASRAPVIKLVNLVLLEAVKRRASDVHVQPYEDRLAIRFRIDGVLHDVFDPPPALQAEIISRIKVMGGMNIAEHRLAQDGRATVEVGDRVVDLRVSTLPTSFGERAVIRLLDKSSRLYHLSDLGMRDVALEMFRKQIHMDHGIILVTGPTGSGKSTTLYAALQEINSKELNILTLEDPIEYRLEGISQTQVNYQKGMTFASGLRHVLRQDPDIIMVGEIRDGETARMAIQSALTGHLVFSTLHTNDAAGAVTRMLDLGVEPYLLASSLLGVLAQRLVRRICPECRAVYAPVTEDFHRWNLMPEDMASQTLYKGAGCPACSGTGYTERIGIFEMLTVTEPIREQILQRGKSSSIKSLAVENGMQTLHSCGLEKAAQGHTTLDEVARVTSRDEF
jgi:general secretion pathway protein E